MKAKSRKRSNVVGRDGALRGYTELRKEILLRFQTDYVWRLLIEAKGSGARDGDGARTGARIPR